MQQDENERHRLATPPSGPNDPGHPESAESLVGSPADAPLAIEPAPRRRRAGVLTVLLVLVAAVGLLATIGAFLAIQFRDRDERLRAVAEAVEAAENDPGAAFQRLKNGVAALFSPPAQVAQAPMSRAVDPVPQPAPEASPTAPDSSAPIPSAPSPSAKTSPAPEAAIEPAPAPAPVISPAPSLSQAEPEPPPATPARPSANAAANDAGRGDTGRSDTSRGDGLDENSYVHALEGRIDELSDEVKALRESLAAPKNESRAEREIAPAPAPAPAAPPTAPAASMGGPAEQLVVAQSLIHELEKGRPYAMEQSALESLGADPQLLAALAPAAEKGAPTASKLREALQPAAKEMRAAARPKSKDSPSALDRIASFFSRVIHIRHKNDPQSVEVDALIGKMDDALRRGDVDAAATAFEALPEASREAAKPFGEDLLHRRDAEKAAAALLNGAIAALSHRKN